MINGIIVQNNPVNWIDPNGLDVTVNLYPGAGGFGHVGVGVNTNNTVGFYPVADASGLDIAIGDVPGHMSPDQRTPSDSTTIKTTPEQDVEMIKAIIDKINNPGNYNLYNDNCATTVRDILQAGGIDTPETILPRKLMKNLQAR